MSMIIVPARTMIMVHACNIIIIHACTMIIVYACTMIIEHACTMITVHVSCPTWLMFRELLDGGPKGKFDVFQIRQHLKIKL